MGNIEFDKAVSIAMENAKKLLTTAKDFNLEEVLISEDGKCFEVTLSYTTQGFSNDEAMSNNRFNPLMQRLAARRAYRTFLVDAKTGVFRGFRIVRDR